MKKITIVSVAALLMLGAGPVFAPDVMSVCTEPDPSIARVATQYYNDLGFTQKGVDLGALPEALGTEDPIRNDPADPNDPAKNDKLDLRVEKLQKAVATAVNTPPIYDVKGAVPNADNGRGDMGIVDANLEGTGAALVPLSVATSLQERIVRVGTAVEANGEGGRVTPNAPLTPDTTYPGDYTPLAVRLDDLNSLIGTKKVYTQAMVAAPVPNANAADIGKPIKADGTVTDPGALVDAADNYPFSKWSDENLTTIAENRSMYIQLKSLITGLNNALEAAGDLSNAYDATGVTTIQGILDTLLAI